MLSYACLQHCVWRARAYRDRVPRRAAAKGAASVGNGASQDEGAHGVGKDDGVLDDAVGGGLVAHVLLQRSVGPVHVDSVAVQELVGATLGAEGQGVRLWRVYMLVCVHFL